MTPEPSERRERAAVLWRYFAATYVAVVLNEAGFLLALDHPGWLAGAFAADVLVTGAAFHLAAAVLPTLALNAWRGRPERRRLRDGLVYGASVALTSAVQGFLLMDRHVFGIYGFHLNGFVWNLLTTPGGVDSMGAGSSTLLTFGLVGLAIVGVQAGLLALVLKVPAVRRLGEGRLTRRRVAAAAAAFAALVVAEKLAYGVSMFRSYGPVLAASANFPLYVPVSFSTFLRRLGFSDAREGLTRVSGAASRLNYPLRPLTRAPGARPLNVVWLVSESLRADMLDPEVMPAAWAFAQRSVRFTRHYSGGNGTRMGMFSMFYGLPGTYWAPCLAELRSPVLMDLLQDAGYEMTIYTSAGFSFPELDKTVFSRVPRALLHETKGPQRWGRDRDSVTAILSALDRRDRSKPFFTFMFFESPHAPYHFPDECIIRRPFTRDVNYLTMDVRKDAAVLKNSYVNACRHLDTQLARVLAYLEEKGLLDSTIVLITGDHGEEFMEKGRWGHHSAFTEEQTRVPLVLHAPGVAPRTVDRLTSHLDLPATVLTLLGVTTPPGDYSLGQDLLGGPPREYAAISGWTEVAYVDDAYKAVFPMKAYDVVHRGVTTTDDAPADRGAFFTSRRERLARLIRELRRFQK
jgi:hypothetical protein